MRIDKCDTDKLAEIYSNTMELLRETKIKLRKTSSGSSAFEYKLRCMVKIIRGYAEENEQEIKHRESIKIDQAVITQIHPKSMT